MHGFSIQFTIVMSMAFKVLYFWRVVKNEYWLLSSEYWVLLVYYISCSRVHRAGLTILPFMPWHRAPIVRGPRGHLLNFSYHITFYNHGSIRVWRCIGLFYQTAPVLKSTGHFFIKGGPNRGPQDRVPETRAPAKFYVMLWLQFVVWRHVCWQHQC